MFFTTIKLLIIVSGIVTVVAAAALPASFDGLPCPVAPSNWTGLSKGIDTTCKSTEILPAKLEELASNSHDLAVTGMTATQIKSWLIANDAEWAPASKGSVVHVDKIEARSEVCRTPIFITSSLTILIAIVPLVLSRCWMKLAKCSKYPNPFLTLPRLT